MSQIPAEISFIFGSHKTTTTTCSAQICYSKKTSSS